MTFLLNGWLIDGSAQAWFDPGCDIHAVSCAERPMIMRITSSIESAVRVRLAPGESVVLEHTGGLFAFAAYVSEPCVNKDEQKFVKKVVRALKIRTESARELKAILGGKVPSQALLLITNTPEINLFESNETKKCVVRKQPKPKYHRRCPKVKECSIGGFARRANNGEPLWRQCGASFSTIMRHFQKSPDEFRWRTDEDNRTMLSHA